MELAQRELVAAEKEQMKRTLTAQFQRELMERQEEWRRDSRRQLEPLQEQLRDAQRASLETPAKSELDSLVHSLHAEFHRTLHLKQEEWKAETKAQVGLIEVSIRNCVEKLILSESGTLKYVFIKSYSNKSD